MIWGAILGGALSVLAGKGQADAAKDAAAAQAQAAQRQLDFAKQVYGDTTQRFKPYYDAGTNALAAYNSELGLGKAPKGYGGYQASPGYDWRMSQGRDAALSAAGGTLSGATLDSLQRMGQGIANQDYQQYLDRLNGMVGVGSGAAGNQANAGANYLAAGTSAMGSYGNALAAGKIGAANAWSDALGNIVGGFGYMSGQGGQGSNGLFSGGGLNVGNLFGPNAWS